MARNRMIKPEYWSDETLSKLSLESNLLFIGLWNYADDYGVLLNSNRRIMGDIFPFRDKINEEKIIKWKNELIESGRIIRVCVNEQEYLIIRHWKKHQTVPNPSKRRFLDDAMLIQVVDLYEDNNTQITDYLDTNEGLIRVYFSKEQRTKIKEERIKNKDKEITLEKNSPTQEEVEAYFLERSKKEFGKVMDKDSVINESKLYLNIRIENKWIKANGKMVKNWKNDAGQWILHKRKELISYRNNKSEINENIFSGRN